MQGLRQRWSASRRLLQQIISRAPVVEYIVPKPVVIAATASASHGGPDAVSTMVWHSGSLETALEDSTHGKRAAARRLQGARERWQERRQNVLDVWKSRTHCSEKEATRMCMPLMKRTMNTLKKQVTVKTIPAELNCTHNTHCTHTHTPHKPTHTCTQEKK